MNRIISIEDINKRTHGALAIRVSVYCSVHLNPTATVNGELEFTMEHIKSII